MKHPDNRTEPAPFLLLRRSPWMAVLVMLLASLLVAEIALQLARSKGWTTYVGFDTVSAVAVNGQGQAWVAGYRRNIPALMLYTENKKPVEVSLPSELNRTSPPSLMVDSQDQLWVGTEEGMVGMQDVNDQWILFTPENFGMDFYSIWDMVMDRQGQVWVRSHRGPGRIDPGSSERTFAFTNSGLADSDAVALATDPKGQLWILTLKRDLKVLEPDGTWKTVMTVPGTVRNSIYGSILAFDAQGQIWMATGGGVGVLRPDGAWTEYPLGDAPGPLFMSAILPDADGQVWIGTSHHGLFMFDPKTGWTNYTNRNSGLFSDVNALALDEHGRLWIGSSQGRVSAFHPEAALPVNSISAIRTVARTIVPAILLIVAVLTILAFMFGSSIQGNIKIIVEFSIAFAGWFVIGALLWVYIRDEHARSGGLFFINPLALIPPIVNILLLLVLYGLQRRMAWGAFSAFLVNWIGLIVVTPAAEPFSGAPFWESVLMLPFFLPH